MTPVQEAGVRKIFRCLAVATSEVCEKSHKTIVNECEYNREGRRRAGHATKR